MFQFLRMTVFKEKVCINTIKQHFGLTAANLGSKLMLELTVQFDKLFFEPRVRIRNPLSSRSTRGTGYTD